ncbi:hypothetical protein G1H10_13550 [Phytoactinopolyspora halotolerans]|uniref:RiboL-PSP-HEPN domain-containing protein n=1 Tax=Phytoactinopolyspora halotolerans TaxID=1981512 RepID=A0A6L9S853_9ACTN|nr:hypothetical protein [Phytoactinopolyspora halotolerans]
MVLLCSHYERYVYGINEEAIDFLNSCSLLSERIPESVRLLQVKLPIDELSRQQWDSRAPKLYEFALNHAAHWSPGAPVTNLDAAAILSWMKSPKPRDVKRYFLCFGEEDIFSRITRSENTRRDLFRHLQGLVDSRNGIAHGDSTVQPLPTDITEYCSTVLKFATRVDRVFSRLLARIARTSHPW